MPGSMCDSQRMISENQFNLSPMEVLRIELRSLGSVTSLSMRGSCHLKRCCQG